MVDGWSQQWHIPRVRLYTRLPSEIICEIGELFPVAFPDLFNTICLLQRVFARLCGSVGLHSLWMDPQLMLRLTPHFLQEQLLNRLTYLHISKTHMSCIHILLKWNSLYSKIWKINCSFSKLIILEYWNVAEIQISVPKRNRLFNRCLREEHRFVFSLLSRKPWNVSFCLRNIWFMVWWGRGWRGILRVLPKLMRLFTGDLFPPQRRERKKQNFSSSFKRVSEWTTT